MDPYNLPIRHASLMEANEARWILTNPHLIAYHYAQRRHTIQEALQELNIVEYRKLALAYLKKACKEGDAIATLIFIHLGAHPDQYNNTMTACMWAASKGQDLCLRICLHLGANPNMNVRGATPLYKACSVGSIDCVRVLMEYKADPKIKVHSFTPLAISTLHKFEGCVQLLLAHGAPADDQIALRFATWNDCSNIVKRLLDANANPNALENISGSSPLIRVCSGMCHIGVQALETAGHLIAAGANVNMSDFEGNTALQLAAHARGQGVPNMVRKLLRAGAHIAFNIDSVQSNSMRAYQMLQNCARGGWTRDNHDLFPSEKRKRAIDINIMGYMLAKKYGYHFDFVHIWQEHIMFHAIQRA